MIVGSAAVDVTAQAGPTVKDDLVAHSTAPGSIMVSLGGVARNIAEASHRLLTAQSSVISSVLVSPIGEDLFGTLMVDATKKIGMRVDGFITSKNRTAICNMILESNGNLISGVADMGITASLDGELVMLLCSRAFCLLVNTIHRFSPSSESTNPEYLLWMVICRRTQSNLSSYTVFNMISKVKHIHAMTTLILTMSLTASVLVSGVLPVCMWLN